MRGRGPRDGSPRGGVVEAGIPPQERVDFLPLPEPIFYLHYYGFGRLPDDPCLQEQILNFARSADFLRDMPRASAKRLLASPDRAGLCEEDLAGFLKILFSEITRRMYIEAARKRPGAIGVQFSLTGSGHAAPEAMAVVSADAHGLGAGVYPFTHIPENSCPGAESPFVIRVVMKKGSD